MTLQGIVSTTYYQLGCYALMGTDFLEFPTVEGIQALVSCARTILFHG
jgi:hypothetical protein